MIGASMSATNDPIEILSRRFIDAIRGAFPEAGEGVDPLIRPCGQPELGDFQCNVAMALAKRLGKKPRDVAGAIAAAVDLSGVAHPLTEGAIAGPGFINIRLLGDALAASLAAMDDAHLGVAPAAQPERVVVDLMGVNLAKQMHVGHLRSPLIGDAIARTFARLGHTVIRQNHLGDWGLPIAMVTARLVRLETAGKIDLNTLTLDQLDEAYRAAQMECQRDTAGLEAVRRFGLGPKAEAELEAQVEGATEAFMEARRTLVALQAKEPKTYAVWQRVRDVTMRVCMDVCARLHVDVTDEHSAGESFYADELAGVVGDLVTRGIAEESDGALIVRLDDPRWGDIETPCLIRKRDGGYLYATTDVAAIRHRVQRLHADRIVYCIDARQALHLRQVFGVSLKAGYAANPVTGRDAVMRHAAFGSVLGEDGRPFKTRSGESVRLSDLLEETVVRAQKTVNERSPDQPEEESRRIAEAVGMAAIKYADLSNDRVKDYVFSFDRMLAFEGNTGPYLLYALVRTRSILRKAAAAGVGDSWRRVPPGVNEPAEKMLALTLLRYPAALAGVADALEPHRLCQYLFELSGVFGTFFDQCPVLQSEGAVRDGRLRLCWLTGRVLEDGLTVLGIPLLERM